MCGPWRAGAGCSSRDTLTGNTRQRPRPAVSARNGAGQDITRGPHTHFPAERIAGGPSARPAKMTEAAFFFRKFYFKADTRSTICARHAACGGRKG
eukprot:scaffold1892_cov94-Isochrysis_galbana.AAC.2